MRKDTESFILSSEYDLTTANASVVTRYPEDFSQLIESYPENIVKEYLENTEKVLTWLKQNKKFLK